MHVSLLYRVQTWARTAADDTMSLEDPAFSFELSTPASFHAGCCLSHSHSQLSVPERRSWSLSYSVSRVPACVRSSVGFQLTWAWALQVTACEVIHLGPSPLLLTFSLGWLTVNGTKAYVLNAMWWAEKAISGFWLSGSHRPSQQIQTATNTDSKKHLLVSNRVGAAQPGAFISVPYLPQESKSQQVNKIET